ncbi:unnamed protein product [Cyclocybe aegerita]|uniref:Uncharacterized protein n=1 Tax=Cyclocybe aegerita TaxID=1973307 RepID=A0A8S0WSW7_CYCAE|nr:unnamed protein product [Cyclocybe aegerita]
MTLSTDRARGGGRSMGRGRMAGGHCAREEKLGSERECGSVDVISSPAPSSNVTVVELSIMGEVTMHRARIDGKSAGQTFFAGMASFVTRRSSSPHLRRQDIFTNAKISLPWTACLPPPP